MGCHNSRSLITVPVTVPPREEVLVKMDPLPLKDCDPKSFDHDTAVFVVVDSADGDTSTAASSSHTFAEESTPALDSEHGNSGEPSTLVEPGLSNSGSEVADANGINAMRAVVELSTAVIDSDERHEALSSPFSAHVARFRSVSEDGSASLHTLTDVQRLIFQGVLQGFSSVTAPQFAADLKDANAAITVSCFKSAVEHFQRRTLSSSLKGLEDLASGLDILMVAMKAADFPELEINRLNGVIVQMRTSGEVVYDVGCEFCVNNRDILMFVETATADFYAFEWENFGMRIGRIVDELATGPRASPVPPTCWVPF